MMGLRGVITPVPDSTQDLDLQHFVRLYCNNSNSNSTISMIQLQFGTNSTCGSDSSSGTTSSDRANFIVCIASMIMSTDEITLSGSDYS